MAYLDRRSAPHITTLVLAAATAALATNVFLPSLPGMARYFNADYAVMQLAVSLYLAATAFLQLFIGPASDRFGRRPVMLFCFGVFIAATVAAIFAQRIEAFLALRVLQASSAAGMVLSRAIVRDTVPTDQAASRIGYITMGMSLVPMIAPAIGGLLDELYDWRAGFLLCTAFGLVSFAAVYFDLGETNRSISSSLTAQFRAYPALARSQRFWGYTLTAAFTSGAFFAFLGGGPYVATEFYGLSPSGYGLFFGVISVGYMLGNFLSGRFSRRVGINPMMLGGNIASVVGMVIALALMFIGSSHPASFFGPLFFTGVGNGMTLPNANAGIVSVKPQLAGSASGLGGAMQIGGGAALSVLGGALLGPATGAAPLILVMAASSFCGILATLWVMRVAARKGEL